MSPKKPKARPDGHAPRTHRLAHFVVPLVVVFAATPFVFTTTAKLDDDGHEQIAFAPRLGPIIAVSMAMVVLIFNSYTYLSSCWLEHDQNQLIGLGHWQTQIFSLGFIPKVLFGNSRESPAGKQRDGRSFFPFYRSDDQNHAKRESFSARKIDPKYFKPKFIIHELITFWDTTCMVITWSSFYVIGGTIVATEKLTRKIKARSRAPNSREGSFVFGGNDSGTSRGTGQSDFSFSSFSSGFAPQNETEAQQQQQQPSDRLPFRKISSWTKRSVASIKKKLSRATNSNARQLTLGPANESTSSIFFFATNSAATES